MPSKGSGPYANRISEAFRIDFVHRYVFAVNNKTTNLGVLTNKHISAAFRIDVVNQSLLLRSTTKPPIYSIRGRFDQKPLFMRGAIVPPSKLIVANNPSPKREGFYLGGLIMRGVDPTKHIICLF